MEEGRGKKEEFSLPHSKSYTSLVSFNSSLLFNVLHLDTNILTNSSQSL